MSVKSLGNKETSSMHTPKKKIDLGQYSYSAQVKVVSRRQPQAQPTRFLHTNFPQAQIYQGKNPIMQAHLGKQPSLGQQQRRRDLSNNQDNHKDMGRLICMLKDMV